MERERIREYLRVLACPLCKKELLFAVYQEEEGFFCNNCEKFYRIEEEIPNMLPEEALNIKKELLKFPEL